MRGNMMDEDEDVFLLLISKEMSGFLLDIEDNLETYHSSLNITISEWRKE
jgi:hypothetical protein